MLNKFISDNLGILFFDKDTKIVEVEPNPKIRKFIIEITKAYNEERYNDINAPAYAIHWLFFHEHERTDRALESLYNLYNESIKLGDFRVLMDDERKYRVTREEYDFIKDTFRTIKCVISYNKEAYVKRVGV